MGVGQQKVSKLMISQANSTPNYHISRSLLQVKFTAPPPPPFFPRFGNKHGTSMRPALVAQGPGEREREREFSKYKSKK